MFVARLSPHLTWSSNLQYIVTYLIDGKRATAQIEARDAASAYAKVEKVHDLNANFELLSVLLLDAATPASRLFAAP
jgi:hypothetical protein